MAARELVQWRGEPQGWLAGERVPLIHAEGAAVATAQLCCTALVFLLVAGQETAVAGHGDVAHRVQVLSFVVVVLHVDDAGEVDFALYLFARGIHEPDVRRVISVTFHGEDEEFAPVGEDSPHRGALKFGDAPVLIVQTEVEGGIANSQVGCCACCHVKCGIGRLVGDNAKRPLTRNISKSVGLDVQVIIAARLKILKIKDAVVVVVGDIGAHKNLALVEFDHRTVDGVVGIDTCWGIGVERVFQCVVGILHGAHDVACALGSKIPIVGTTSRQSHALLPTIIFIERTMASGMIGVEEALVDEPRRTMFEHAVIARIDLAIAASA